MSKSACTAGTGLWRNDLLRRIHASLHARCIGVVERVLGPLRQRLLADVCGDVIEIGPGVGCNFAYLPAGVRYIGIEPNLHMWRHCQAAARRFGHAIELVEARAEALPFEAVRFDMAIATHVLCSVDDPAVAISELRRVLRPGGRLVFIEHVAAPVGTRLHRRQACWRRLWRLATDGCHPDRNTDILLQSAGFDTLTLDRADLPLPLVGPHVWGVGQWEHQTR